MKNGKSKSSFVKRGQSLFLLSFAGFIALGTLLLKIPGMYQSGNLSWIDSLFIATTSVCVTGLTSVPVYDFSFAGQLVIVILIQGGGLGIMTLSATILLALGRGLSFSDSLLISNLNDNFSLRSTESLLKTVTIYTFSLETAGFIAILPGVLVSDGIGFWEGLWGSFFLSISSFCNAGLTTFQDSLVGIHRSAQFASSLLAITGGLGVYVIYDLLQFFRKRQHHLRIHSKLVITTTIVLLAGGTLLVWFFGWSSGKPIDWFDAYFFSATSRTCGCHTAHVADLPRMSIFFLMVLMMIGGSPGSAAGGIKTSTVALALAAIFNTLRGNTEILLFRRKVPTITVLRAFTIIMIFTLIAVSGAFVLQLTEPGKEMLATSFEAVSALTTTGLSVGDTTAEMSTTGKSLLVFFMFLGRVGPFTALLFLLGREKPGQLKFPEERVIIG